MEKRNILLIVIILILLAGFAFLFFTDKEGNIDTPDNTNKTLTEENFTLSYSYLGDSKWEYKVEGTLPNPCYKVTTDVLVAESYPEQVSVRVTVQAPDADVACIQVIEPYQYTGEFSASEKATVALVVQ